MQSFIAPASRTSAQLIRVAVVDDHQAIRAGLESMIATTPGIKCTGVASDGEQLAPLLYRARPDVVVLDYHLPRTNGLMLCRQIKRDVLAPAVVVYSAFADAALVIPSMVAGADALVDKTAPVRVLLQAIRRVARGGTWLPEPIPELLADARDSVEPDDLPILDQLLERTTPARIATKLELARSELEQRIDRILERLSVRVAGPPAAAEREPY